MKLSANESGPDWDSIRVLLLSPHLSVLRLRDEAPVHLPDTRSVRSEDSPGDVEGGESVGLLIPEWRVELSHWSRSVQMLGSDWWMLMPRSMP